MDAEALTAYTKDATPLTVYAHDRPLPLDVDLELPSDEVFSTP